jgi:holo-[acyl-carrier protein] synthase
MILGVGVDIVEVSRVNGVYGRHGNRFLERILRPAEIAYCLSHQRPGPHLAARFAAKEAIAKAFGGGLGKAPGWQDVEVLNHDSGEPYVVLHGPGLRLLASRGASRLHLSLSHTEHYAAAVAILEGASAGEPQP